MEPWELLQIPVKTLIFCDWLDLGEKIAKAFNIPFVYGETRDRLEIIRESQACVVSRVGDEGISLPGIERVIEVAFLFGSRMQESQRFGRLMHSAKEEPEHILLMFEEEFENYQKRLYAITERGFRIEFVRWKTMVSKAFCKCVDLIEEMLREGYRLQIPSTHVERLIKIHVGADKRTIQKYMKMLTEDLGFLESTAKNPLGIIIYK